jgi:hypothetical protein
MCASFNVNTNSFGVSINKGNSVVSNNNSTFTRALNSQLNLSDHECTLHSATLYNAIANIQQGVNDTFKYIGWDANVGGTTERTVNLLQNGATSAMLSIDDINGILQQTMYNNQDYLNDSNGNPVYFLSISGNALYNLTQVTAASVPTTGAVFASNTPPTGYTYPTNPIPSGYGPAPPKIHEGVSTDRQFRFKVETAGFATLLGFPIGTYPSVANNTGSSVAPYDGLSNNTPEISTVNSLTIRSNVAGPSDFSNIPNLLAPLTINAGYNEQITYEPANLQWIYVPKQTYSQIEIRICDQNGNPVVLRDSGHNFNLEFRRRKD